ncbi:hypothetical protein DX914_18790 [Lysobacter silvisoli]|uniref:Uncharacterized protein n=2 Tax=Lysobacter silvisoli TaxID=2293254 RepID=A0A371JXC7_9GAMM|nr:hypothetical protein DX914_18790 [Lysobacter silvisoli]
MYKVIVERPRRGGGYNAERQPPIDPEDQPQHESLKLRHRSRKWLNENLRPLERYLHAQAGRPWDRVYSELCARIDRRNTVQQHIHQHLEQFVVIRPVVFDNRLHYQLGWGVLRPLNDPWAPKLYVDPDSGLLLDNRAACEAKREFRRRRSQERAARPSPDVRNLDELRQLRRIDGIWYEIGLAPLPARVSGPAGKPSKTRPTMPYDVVIQGPAQWIGKPCGHPACTACQVYGRTGVYAHSKRQLNRHELQRHGLSNHDDRRLH